MKKKSERMKLYDKIHKEMRDIRILGYGERCVICGSEDVVQLGHIVPAGKSLNLRFDLFNTYPQCRVCNGVHRYNQVPYINWFVQTFGEEELEELNRLSRVTKKYNMTELREKLEEMKEIKKNMQ